MAFESIEQLKRNGTNCRLLKSLQVVHQRSVKTLFISTLTFPENAGAQNIQQSGMPLCQRVHSLHLIKGVPVISGNKAWKSLSGVADVFWCDLFGRVLYQKAAILNEKAMLI